MREATLEEIVENLGELIEQVRHYTDDDIDYIADKLEACYEELTTMVMCNQGDCGV